jgi:hypothetical protein
MRMLPITAGVLTVAATVVVCLVIPASLAISVGDGKSAVGAIEVYGYPKSFFSLSSKAAGFDTPTTPVAFNLGDGWHLLVWHNDRVQRLVHFQYVPSGESRYGDWIHARRLESFDVPRPSLAYYFVGLTVALGIGWATRRSRWRYRIAMGSLLFVIVVGDLAACCFAVSVATFPICMSLGWVAAFLLGGSLRRDENDGSDCSREEKYAKLTAMTATQP